MPDDDPKREHARQGKLARLPDALREMANQRILDGWTGKRICAWLNSLPEVQEILAADFEGELISENNLSRWRKGGYQDWLGERDKVVRLRSLAEYCAKVAEAGKDSIFAGASNILGGKILDLLEICEAGDALGMAKAIVALRKNEIESVKQRREDVKLGMSERSLQLEESKYKRETLELFAKWFENEQARQIMLGGGDKETKLGELAELFWGPMPDNVGPLEGGARA